MRQLSQLIDRTKFTKQNVGSHGATYPFCAQTLGDAELNTTVLRFVTGLGSSLRRSRYTHLTCAAAFLKDPYNHAPTKWYELLDEIKRGKGCVICREKECGPFVKIELTYDTSLCVCFECLAQATLNDVQAIEKRAVTFNIVIRERTSRREKLLEKQRAIQKIAQYGNAYIDLQPTVLSIRADNLWHNIAYRELKVKFPFVAPRDKTNKSMLQWLTLCSRLCEMAQRALVEAVENVYVL